jgi:hypothetical protein
MKTLVIFLFLVFTTLVGYTQDTTINIISQQLPIDSTTDQISFVRIVELPGTPKNQIYTGAREWFTFRYPDARKVLQMEDAENGVLIGKAARTFKDGLLTQRMVYTIKIYVKDNKYKAEITNIYYEEEPSKVNGYTTGVSIRAEAMITDEALFKKDGKPRKMNANYKINTFQIEDFLLNSLESRIKSNISPDSSKW